MEIGNIITLANGENYYLAEEYSENGTLYVYAAGVDEDESLNGKESVFQVIIEDGDEYLQPIKDKALYNHVMEEIKEIIAEKISDITAGSDSLSGQDFSAKQDEINKNSNDTNNYSYKRKFTPGNNPYADNTREAFNYYTGTGVEQDYKSAFQLFTLSAVSGDADAQNFLGVMYLNGQGTEKDYVMARRWFEQAANQGDVSAMQALSDMYNNGLGVARDPEMAKMWLKKAKLDTDDLKNEFAEMQKKEALDRLATIEKTVNINPKIRYCFAEGRLYYSYMTAGGLMCSIDTIHYNENYAKLCEIFEKETGSLVYHAIERDNTLALLYVSDSPSKWEKERPIGCKVYAKVCDMENRKAEEGYITFDGLQGAIIRVNDRVDKEPVETSSNTPVQKEIIERLRILQATAMTTDLDVAGVYEYENELCCSSDMPMLGITLVDRMSQKSNYKKLYDIVAPDLNADIYFAMCSEDGDIAFLFVAGNEENWDEEKEMLQDGIAVALVVDMEEGKASIETITFVEVDGGPVFERIEE